MSVTVVVAVVVVSSIIPLKICRRFSSHTELLKPLTATTRASEPIHISKLMPNIPYGDRYEASQPISSCIIMAGLQLKPEMNECRNGRSSRNNDDCLLVSTYRCVPPFDDHHQNKTYDESTTTKLCSGQSIAVASCIIAPWHIFHHYR